MKLWTEGTGAHSAGRVVQATIKEQVKDISRQALSRGVRALNALRNAELETLKGQRSGRVYRKPHTKQATYTASAPGEVPARRTGNLRLHWNGQVKQVGAGRNGTAVSIELESQEKYAEFLENGTAKMAPRPFVEKIKEKAEPEIARIYSSPYR